MSSERFLSIAWNNVADRGRNNSIRIQDIFVLISEIEKLLNVRNLLNKEEIRLLMKMMKEKPSLRLYRNGLQTFLIKLVHFPSIADWLRARGNIQLIDIEMVVRRQESRGAWSSKAYDGENNPQLEFQRQNRVPKYGRSSDLDYHEYTSLDRSASQGTSGIGGHISRDENSFRPTSVKFEESVEAPKTEPDLARPRTSLESEKRHANDWSIYNSLRSQGDGPTAFDKENSATAFSGKGHGWKEWVSRFWSKPQKLEQEKSAHTPRLGSQDTKLRAIVENQNQLLHSQEVLIRNLENRLYGGQATFSIYRFLKSNRFTKRLPIIRNTDFSTISTVEIAAKMTLFLCAGLVALAIFIIGVFLTIKSTRMVLYVVQSVASHASTNGYSSDEDIQFSWLQEYPWLEYQLYNLYDAFGY